MLLWRMVQSDLQLTGFTATEYESRKANLTEEMNLLRACQESERFD